jgi:hypothetical protein
LGTFGARKKKAAYVWAAFAGISFLLSDLRFERSHYFGAITPNVPVRLPLGPAVKNS